jgi:hypothetical protein
MRPITVRLCLYSTALIQVGQPCQRRRERVEQGPGIIKTQICTLMYPVLAIVRPEAACVEKSPVLERTRNYLAGIVKARGWRADHLRSIAPGNPALPQGRMRCSRLP